MEQTPIKIPKTLTISTRTTTPTKQVKKIPTKLVKFPTKTLKTRTKRIKVPETERALVPIPRKRLRKSIEQRERERKMDEPMIQSQMVVHQYSYTDVGGEVQEYEREIKVEKPGEAVVRTRTPKGIEERKLTREEVQELMENMGGVFCDAFLASGLPCPHPPKFLQITPTKVPTKHPGELREPEELEALQDLEEQQGGGQRLVCGYHRGSR